MRLRSLLFVPGDRPERMAKAVGLGADALILDLEDSVVPAARADARAAVRAFLDRPRDGGPALLIRVNPLDSAFAADDAVALAGAAFDGIVLPKAEGRLSVARWRALLPGDYPVLPIATETPRAVFTLGDYDGAGLAGLTWGAEDLPAAIGATTAREPDGGFTDPYRIVRALTLFGAHAAGVAAIETVYPDFRDLDGLAGYAARARRDGFAGMMAIHPTQIAVINAAFSPTADELAQARRVAALFAAQPGAGALQLDGRMLDAPHLKAAQRLLAAAGE